MAYSLFACADDQAAARAVAADALRRALVPGIEAHLAGLDFAAELMTRTSGKAGAGVLDDRWTEKLTVSGTPGDCAARISVLHAAGADSICLVPNRRPRSVLRGQPRKYAKHSTYSKARTDDHHPRHRPGDESKPLQPSR